MNLYKKPQRKFQRAMYRSSDLNQIWSMDLVDYSTDKGNNKGYILVGVDMFSRYVRAYSMKTKSEAEITKGLKELFKHGQPKKIHSDQESGLVHNKFLQSQNITVYHTKNSHANLAERFIRTMKEHLQKVKDSEPCGGVACSTTQPRFGNWRPFVQEVVNKINHQKNVSIGMSPEKAQESSNRELINQKYERVAGKIAQRPFSKLYKFGDVVLTVKPKDTFYKGYKKQWNEIPHQIHKVLFLRPQRYELINLLTLEIDPHKYYHEELQKISIDDAVALLPKHLTKRTRPVQKPTFVREPIMTRSRTKK